MEKLGHFSGLYNIIKLLKDIPFGKTLELTIGEVMFLRFIAASSLIYQNHATLVRVGEILAFKYEFL